MENLINVQIENKDGINVVSSRVVAEQLGKEHGKVIRSLENIILTEPDVASLIIQSSYVDKKGELRKEYLLTKDGFTLYMFNIQGYNDFKMAYINAFNEMEQALKSMQPALPDFTNPAEAARAWATEYEAKQQALLENERLQLENTEMKREVTHKENVIIGLVGDIDLATKRQRITQIIRKGADGNFRERFHLLYSEFEKKYHIDLTRRLDNCEEMTPPIKNKMDYIDRVMNMIPQLYEVTCKLFENDLETLKKEWDDTI